MTETERKDWRKLCAAAAKERDSERLVSLINQILQAFDEHEAARAQAFPRNE